MDRSFFKLVYIFNWVAHSLSVCPVYAADLDVSHLLTGPSRCQRGGTCHIYAAATLFEMYCKKMTGKDIRISTDYLLFQHLLAETKRKTRHITEDPKALSGSSLTNMDGGDAQTTLNRILIHKLVLSEKEVKDEGAFAKYLDEQSILMTNPVETGAGGLLIGIASGAALKWGTQRKTKDSVCPTLLLTLGGLVGVMGSVGWRVAETIIKQSNRIDQINAHLKPEKFQKLGEKYFGKNNRSTRSQAIRECLENFPSAREHWGGAPTIKQLLEQEMPLLIGGYYDERSREIKTQGTGTTHITAVLKYRKVANGEEVLIQNSDGKKPQWWKIDGSKTYRILAIE